MDAENVDNKLSDTYKIKEAFCHKLSFSEFLKHITVVLQQAHIVYPKQRELREDAYTCSPYSSHVINM
jgi:hypothetical protein